MRAIVRNTLRNDPGCAAMPKTAKERMAAYRTRQRTRGFTTVSVTVPREDAALLQNFAEERRRMKTHTLHGVGLSKRSLATVDNASRNVSVSSAATARIYERAGNRAESLVKSLLSHVIRLGWHVGTPLGSEAELMKQFGVSRTVLRQTIRLLEHYGIARMQRGAGGGLIIDAPDATATARAVGIYLEYQRIGPSDILETRRILEQATVSFATQRLTQEGEQRLRGDIEAEASLDGNANAESLQRFHFTVADLSGDPALRLFAGIVLQLSDAHSNFARRPRSERDQVVKRIRKLHRQIADAMLAKDVETACRWVRRYLDGYKEWLE